jgi:hypothetical protein
VESEGIFMTYDDFVDSIPNDCVRDICKNGDNQKDAQKWLNIIRLPFNEDKVISLIRESGHGIELEDYENIYELLLWIAAWDKHDREYIMTFGGTE